MRLQIAYPLLSILLGVSLLSACRTEQSEPSPEESFAELQARGEIAMGVDQYTSSHRFDALPDGGRIELQRNVEDPEGVATIRRHLREVATLFKAGDFQVPGFVHAQEVPGTAIMAARRDRITYAYSDLPQGGQVRITTDDPDAIGAIHAFMAFQRHDHRAGGHDHQGHSSGAGAPEGQRH